MGKIDTFSALLQEAALDLRAAKQDMVARLPKIAGHVADQATAEQLSGLVQQADHQERSLAEACDAGKPPKCLWMAGILDDAERDTKQTAPGVLLDVAVIGAVRKGLAAIIVSDETALALARAASDTAAGTALRADCEATIAADHGLRGRLSALTAADPT